MFSKLLSATAVALYTSTLVSAQTHSLCNPVKGDKCKPDAALGGSATIDFTEGESDFFDIADGTTLDYDPANGAVFTINKDTDAPTITSKKYIFFGKVDIEVQASFGTGVVTSCVLQSDDLDEIDWEWLGGDSAQVQTNYFSKGDTSTYDRGGYSPVSNPQTGFHTYTIDWTPDKIDWIIDGATVRTLTYSDAKGGKTFPQTPMQLKLGTWVAGRKDAPEGTVEWAGGYTNFADAPFKGFYKKVTITDYSNNKKGASSYTYGDTSGTMDSIVINAADGSSSSGDSSSTTASGTKTKSASSSTATTLATKAGSAANSTATAPAGTGSGSGSGASATAAGTTGSPSSTTAPSAGIKMAANFVAMGAALFFSYLVL